MDEVVQDAVDEKPLQVCVVGDVDLHETFAALDQPFHCTELRQSHHVLVQGRALVPFVVLPDSIFSLLQTRPGLAHVLQECENVRDRVGRAQTLLLDLGRKFVRLVMKRSIRSR